MITNFVLIVGAAKSGTTSLFNYLAEHPEVSRCRTKEPHFFTNNEKFSRGWNWYQSLWKWDPDVHKIAMEASTGYSKVPYFPNAAERIAEMPASFRFIYLMRNPLERIESHFSHGQIAKWQTTEFEWNQESIGEELIHTSSYAKQISNYYSRFPPDRIKLILFEDLIEDRLNTLRDICKFLELDHTFQFQKTGRSYSRSQDRIANPLIRSLNRSRLARRIRPKLPYTARRKLKSAFASKNNQRFVLSPELREDALEKLKPDLRILRDEYGVNIQRWDIDI